MKMVYIPLKGRQLLAECVRYVSIIMLGLVPHAGLAGTSSSEDAQIRALIRQLGSVRFAERESASKALESFGERALGALRTAAKESNDAEIRRRSLQLVETIEAGLFRQIRVFTAHQGPVYAVAFSPDGSRVLSAGHDGIVRIWDVATGKGLARFKADDHVIYCAAFSPDGGRVVSASGGIEIIADEKGAHKAAKTYATMWTWDVRTGRSRKRIPRKEGEIRAVAFFPDGQRVVAAIDDAIELSDGAAEKEVRWFRGHSDTVKSVVVSSDGQFVLTGSDDTTVRLWEVKTGKELRRFVGHKDFVQAVGFSRDGRHAVSGSLDGRIKLWEVESGRELCCLDACTGMVTSVALLRDGSRIVCSGGGQRRLPGAGIFLPVDCAVRVWDIRHERELNRFQGHADVVWSIDVSRDGRYVISGSDDGTARLWRLPPSNR